MGDPLRFSATFEGVRDTDQIGLYFTEAGALDLLNVGAGLPRDCALLAVQTRPTCRDSILRLSSPSQQRLRESRSGTRCKGFSGGQPLLYERRPLR
jgi:hypothetical protein